MLKQIDAQWTQAEWLNFKDEGPVAPGAATRKFRVEDRKRGIVIGYVKWMITMRCYAMHPLNFPLSPKALQDLMDFCEHQTAAHRQKDSK